MAPPKATTSSPSTATPTSLPPALDKSLVKDSAHTSVCPWKGTAHYYSLQIDGKENKDAVWYYPTPKPAAAEIKDRVAFWKGVQVS